MTSYRRFTCDDLLTFTNVNIDKFTETFNTYYYLSYLVRWPEYSTVAEHAFSGRTMGYSLQMLQGRGAFSAPGPGRTCAQSSERWRARRSCGTGTSRR